jgi:orotidine-5'-phosphate decarboxylase
MIRAAVQGACAGAELAGVAAPKVIAVTVLTSSDDAMLASVGVRDTAADQVRRLGTLAGASAADGVVCSPLEAALMREILGDDALVVTPGVRPAGSDAGDQSRIATPAAALAAGASHLVIGRPITAAADPGAAFDVIAAEL